VWYQPSVVIDGPPAGINAVRDSRLIPLYLESLELLYTTMRDKHGWPAPLTDASGKTQVYVGHIPLISKNWDSPLMYYDPRRVPFSALPSHNREPDLSAAQQQAADQLASAQARLADLRKGSRPSELATLDARLAQARASAELSQIELTRQNELLKSGVIATSENDRARLTHERNLAAVNELSAQLDTAKLGARSDAIAAAEAEVSAASAAKARADWNVAQKSQTAPRDALVFDTLYREGEFLAAGQPAVSLLPPENIKVRFFVPEEKFASLRSGQSVFVSLTGHSSGLAAQISYLSPQPEYTPPVLYNRENRAKLVFLVEAVFSAADARDLHPGQPVEVTLKP